MLDVARSRPDVLLAGLKGKAKGRPLRGVHRDPDEPSGQVPLESRPDGHVGGVRPAVPQRNAETLRRPDRHVGPPLPRRLQQRQCEKVRGDGDKRTALVGLRAERGEVADGTRASRILLHHTEELTGGQTDIEVGQHQLEAERSEAGLQHGQGLRQAIRVDHDTRGRPRGCDDA